MLRALKSAILVDKLKPFAAKVDFWDSNEWCERPIDEYEIALHTNLSDSTTVKTENLGKWCDEHDLFHVWESTNPSAETDWSQYPDELRAALEAFVAVSKDTTALRGTTPKAALTAWLEKNKPGLSNNARERVATVANWQPTGGAPRTPGE